MVDLNTSPHSEYDRKVQRLYEAAEELLIHLNMDWETEEKIRALEAAVAAFDGKAFNEVKP